MRILIVEDEECNDIIIVNQEKYNEKSFINNNLSFITYRMSK